MSESDPSTTFKPPYMPFQTFWNFLGDLSEKPLPPQIDRSLMSSKSGTDQANLVGALKAFGLTDERGAVTRDLALLTESDIELRRLALADLVRRFYSEPLKVSEVSGTEAQLRDVFRDEFQITSSDTMRKAIAFFLHAARTAGVELSSHFPQTRGGPGSSGAPRARRSPTRKRPKVPVVVEAIGPVAMSSRSEKTVTLATGGTMTLTVSVDPLTLRGEERAFFYQVVDLLDDYANEHPQANTEADA
ncbi:hypothetical protein [Cellulomonas endometrii]|uniref:hypothetical protein n=1 Tax=Cellulomonas endometrii TaxID=3036301 RepID=UPI0024AD9BCD|nr:hypothetical protein [Cellulomonas endometrii]